ncbi:MAG: hypothetical protein R3A46_05930 [Thermomicrobiales bacterium]
MWRPALLALLLFTLIPAAVAAQPSRGSDDDEVLVRVNGSDTIDAGERVSVAVIVDGDLEISGELTDFAIVINGDMAVLNGARVDGTLWVTDGTLTLRDGSVVTGDIVLSDNARWEIEDGASFTGDVNDGEFSINLDRDVAWQIVIATLVGWLGATLLAVLGAVVFAGIGGEQLWSGARNLSARPGATILSALAFWVGIALLTVPLALSFVGALAIPAVLMLAMIVWFLGFIAFGTRIGASMTGQHTDDPSVNHPYLSSIAGVVALQLILLVAAGALLGAVIALLFGDGREGLAIVFGIPAGILYVILLIIGVFGSGGVVLRAFDAWSSKT